MGMISTSDLRKKARVIVDGEPYVIVENEFVKPGKGQAFNRMKFKNLINGRVLERTIKSGTMIEEADITYLKANYMYNDGEHWTFMDIKTFEQMDITKELLDGADAFLLDNSECEIALWGTRPISVIPPTFMNLEITYTEPAVKGNTSNNVMKDATLETGAIVKVPLFIDTGMKIKVDTRTGEYVERAK